jgi:hypothetical protein
VHHTCADGSGNSYGGMDVKLISPERSISVDLFSEPLQMACEVKTSFKNEPYDPVVLKAWRERTLSQLTTQREIAERCGWKHCLIVNKQWMKDELDKVSKFEIKVNPTCGSGSALPEPVQEEFPSIPLD